ncbi:MAG: DUF1266 domain-containing protein [Gordonia sp. (in: high G+C Gram-positive bacteria)]
MTTLAAGDEFAGHRIIRRLGGGVMGEVYLADHPRLPRQEALRVLDPALAGDADYRDRFRRAADAAVTLLHPNLAPVHDHGETDGCLWMSSAYVDGCDVAARLAGTPGRRMVPAAVAEIAAAVADALDDAHAVGVLHRDLKPTDILLQPGRRGDRVYLTGLGIARPSGNGSSPAATGAFLGNLAYCAPEQASPDGALTGAADQYQLACVVFEMLSGTTPFVTDNPLAMRNLHLAAPPPRITERRPDLPAALDPVVIRALAKNPADRYRSCSEFADALRGTLTPDGRLSGCPAPAGAPSVPPPLTQVPLVPAPRPAVPIRWAGTRCTAEQLRGMACGAYFALSTGDPVDHLRLGGVSASQSRRAIRASWGITDAESAADTVALLELGHVTPDYDAVLAELARLVPPGSTRAAIRVDDRTVPELTPRLAAVSADRIASCVATVVGSRLLPAVLPATTAAWEIGQGVDLVRLAHRAGLLDDARAWWLVTGLGERSAQLYPDWAAFAAAFEWGRALASAEHGKNVVVAADESCAQTRPVLEQLLGDPTSPWLRVALR